MGGLADSLSWNHSLTSLDLGRNRIGEAGGMALDVALHVGTLGAIVWAFRKDVGALLRDPFEGRYLSWIWLVVATLPVAVIGIVFKDSITAAAGTAAGAVVLTIAATPIRSAQRTM